MNWTFAFGKIDPNNAKFQYIVALDPSLLITSTASRVITGDINLKTAHVGVYSVDSGLPYVVNIDTKTKTSKNVLIQDVGCPLWQMEYSAKNNLIYALYIDNSDYAKLISINPNSGASKFIGNFPFKCSVKLEAVKRNSTDGNSRTCYNFLGAGTIFDDQNGVMYLHYAAGQSLGMYVEGVSVFNGQVMFSQYVQHDFESPTFSKNFQIVYSLDMDQNPPYAKYFSMLDVNTLKVVRLSVIPYFVFYENEATYDTDKKIYYTMLQKSMTSANIHLVGINSFTGLVLTSPIYTCSLWGLKYLSF